MSLPQALTAQQARAQWMQAARQALALGQRFYMF
jgi:hypothetical protein